MVAMRPVPPRPAIFAAMPPIPRLLRWIATLLGVFLLLMTLCRVLFYVYYCPPGTALSLSSFTMGLRLDLRIAGILGFLLLLLTAIPALHPFRGRRGPFWPPLLTTLLLLLLLLYVVDFFHYDYLRQRLNASVLNFLEDAGISFSMVWETYPVVRSLLLLAVMGWLTARLFSRLMKRFQRAPEPATSRGRWWLLPFMLLLGFCCWGTLGQFPLRWSDVFMLKDPFQAQLALNPVQSFVSTLSFRTSTYDETKVRKHYRLMADYLGVDNPDSASLNFERRLTPRGPIDAARQPNIVLVICESFSAFKSSMWGNPLNPTPYFDTLCRSGVFFDHCFTPSYGTARGIWATLTGTPDVEFPKTSSRNPSLVDQHTIINDFSGYAKYYFIGGSASWANIRGVLDFNIEGLKLYEQDDYNAEKVDVWGVSDKNVFLGANRILATEQKPFFAVIQTADNHRPYTIPEEDRREFNLVSLPKDSLQKYGYDSNEELNAFRYTDYCFRKFMQDAAKQPFYQNTVFVFIGDHGNRGDAGNMFPQAWTKNSLTSYHVPLLFWSPMLPRGERRKTICSQLDVLPSIAGLISMPYRNTTMGRNLFDTTMQDLFRASSAFVIDPDEKKIGMVAGDHHWRQGLGKAGTELVSIRNNEPVPPVVADSVRSRLRIYTEAFYETARYLLYHNRKKVKP
jgi:phosphoglycerol transferase MdoB-like AlkP superfamily enzyme